MTQPTFFETDVVIIGGGATGTGIMRDCALRNIRCILLERFDISAGSTGRNHGLLHSGARYAVTDPHSAQECIQENRILRHVARHCVEETEGLFISLPEDDLSYQEEFIRACHKASIPTQLLSAKETLTLEPCVNPRLKSAVKVPDGTLDPFRLCSANVLDAQQHGATLLNHTRVIGMIRQQDRIVGVKCENQLTHQKFDIHCQQVINAAGIWGQQVTKMAGVPLTMFPAKGSLLIFDYRLNNLVINRCRKPADADILVPGDTISLIGTTSEHIDYQDIDKPTVTTKEVELLMREGIKLCPSMANARVLRAYAGVRPLVSVDNDGSGRNISRGIVLLDHQQRDGLEGLITITGGKLMTYRLMAEQATDLVAHKLGNAVPCQTHILPLPGSAHEPIPTQKSASSIPIYQAAVDRHGSQANQFLTSEPEQQTIICECEMVTAAEIGYAINQLHVQDLVDLRRRTRLGMGPCQGELCSYRASQLFCDIGQRDGNQASHLLEQFLQERWQGTQPIFWGDALRETELSYWLYEGLMGISGLPTALPTTKNKQGAH
ncbi:anaerobic glycerol-3-phosphate dehydrogenase subunit A [Vibrio porteresiae]|uniref:glycerol-3-phosphate dehydrogenase n=1 Tax=Vibrio porteresiae DSM 19223 TaxID=1123496 RepID=A0ABZ0QHW0_9VIBR|nr:anaerobic glycerol-3-phosphate dehydrogenase subunit A [Vibrio porteresiae]WPC75621.1 anaerobic glycerol-3-phosphate dehydrogenase subunit A [Vibrio porteresiae DSM 19223]